MADAVQTSLRIPEGINFDCSGCGNCCLSWPVPVNGEDIARINALPLDAATAMFRELPLGNRSGGFTHALEKRHDGRCQFLTEANQCQLHVDFGAQAKPAMCQLFPYTFTPTPGGVFASLSFASTAVLMNSGPPLTEQSELLKQKWNLLKRLMPDYSPDWNGIQLIDGQPINWQQYSTVDEKLLKIFGPEASNGKSILELCREASDYSCSLVPKSTDLERNLTDARPRIVDQVLIEKLISFYFPGDVFGDSSIDLPARSIAEQLVKPPHSVPIMHARKSASAGDLLDYKLGSLDQESERLLQRFLYCRIFSKLYFGPGFNNLSLIAGLHHLVCLVALLRIALKISTLHKATEPSFSATAELLRTLERRLTIARFGPESSVIIEVLLSSPTRIQRILSLAA